MIKIINIKGVIKYVEEKTGRKVLSHYFADNTFTANLSGEISASATLNFSMIGGGELGPVAIQAREIEAVVDSLEKQTLIKLADKDTQVMLYLHEENKRLKSAIVHHMAKKTTYHTVLWYMNRDEGSETPDDGAIDCFVKHNRE